jgi:glycerol uptake facilitator-like aquaporin
LATFFLIFAGCGVIMVNQKNGMATFGGKHEPVPVTLPAGTNIQSLVLESFITFYLMFVILAVATDDRAVTNKSLSDLALDATSDKLIE